MGLNESLFFCFEVLPWNDKTTRETGNFRDDFSQKRTTMDASCDGKVWDAETSDGKIAARNKPELNF